MSRTLRTFVCAAAALLPFGTLAAQDAPRCPDGEADEEGIQVSVTVRAHPTRVAAAVDSVLQAQGYTIQDAPAGFGRWAVAPRFTWLPELSEAGVFGDRHPGVLVMIGADAAAGDSVSVVAGARALCKVPPVEGLPGDVGQLVEIMSATLLSAGVTEALDSLSARGGDLMAPVERARPRQASVRAPEKVAGFRIINRHDFPDPAYGTSVRYGRESDDQFLDIYVYPGVRVDSACDAACAVNGEADGFIEGVPEFLRAGHFEQMELADDARLRPGPGAAWAYGRHLTFKAKRRGQVVETHYYLYSFPGFFLKVRATYPPSPASAADVQAFVGELLGKLVASR